MTHRILLTVAMFLLPQSSIQIKSDIVKVIEEPKLIITEDIYKIQEELLEDNIEKALTKQKHQESSAYIEVDKDFEALVSATWRLETGNGESSLWLNFNNPGGVKCGSRYCYYPSKEQGLQSLRTLLARYVDKFGYDLEAIRSVYSESDDTALFTQIFNQEKEKLN